ncbi:D-xylose transporter-like [Anopheles albimanus]|uniref:Major facilitator superfamily (MFS) profile domain-containing protein n=1 Tax=Anopheles albimanus TaxID=7167 RepID=A0A182FJB3_ANOAL|nr:D-xylose transporter-like [Anopheles albimanus]
MFSRNSADLKEITINGISQDRLEQDHVVSMQKSKRQRLGHRARTVLYTLIVSLGYVGAGAMVGWSGAGAHHEQFDSAGTETERKPEQLTNGTISLIAIPAAVLTVTACLVHRWYYWIGTKSFLLAAGLLGVCSATLESLATTFWCASAARILAGIAAGITLTLVPGYVHDFDGGTESNGLLRVLLDELLAAAFPLGVLLRFLVALLPVPLGALHVSAALSGTVSALFFLAGLLLPESARYLCATGQVERATVALQCTHPSDTPASRQSMDGVIARWQLPAALGLRRPGLLEAVVRQGNLMLLVPLLALFAFQASVGAVPLLFYLHDVLHQLGITDAGGSGRSGGTVAVLLATVFTFAGPLVSWLGRHRHRSGSYPHRTLLLGTSLLMALTMLALGWHCHLRGTHSHLPDNFVAGQHGSVVALILFYACSAIGFQRVPWALLDAEVQPDLRFPLRTLATVISWAMVYLTVRLFPILLRTIGIGWLFWNAALVALFAVAVLILTLPRADYDGHRKLGNDLSSASSSGSAYCPRPCVHCAVCSLAVPFAVPPSLALPVPINQAVQPTPPADAECGVA